MAGKKVDYTKPYRLVFDNGVLVEEEQLKGPDPPPSESLEDLEPGSESLEKLVEMGVVKPTSPKKLATRHWRHKEKP
jgi:hypothetical protein